MIGRVDGRGWLEVKRDNVWKYQYCFLADGISRCGDWCPAFEKYGYFSRKLNPETWKYEGEEIYFEHITLHCLHHGSTIDIEREGE